MDPLKVLAGCDAGWQLSVLKKMGGGSAEKGREIAEALRRDELKIVVQEKLKALFDKHGRRIPEGLQANVCDANRDFRLDQPKLDKEVDFANRITRLHGCLSIDTEVTAEQLKTETERLLAVIRENSQIANIANGVCLPVVLPKLVTDNLGAELELYLAGVNNSYTKRLAVGVSITIAKAI